MISAAIAPVLAAASSLVLAVAALARPPRTAVRWTFALGMLAFAGETAAAFVLLTQTETPETRALWLGLVEIAGLAVAVPWGLFVLALLGIPARRLAEIGRAHV